MRKRGESDAQPRSKGVSARGLLFLFLLGSERRVDGLMNLRKNSNILTNLTPIELFTSDFKQLGMIVEFAKTEASQLNLHLYGI